ncbi:MAG: dTDP-4-dehydrorhamnose reductase [Burkholderiaceae bacterium]
MRILLFGKGGQLGWELQRSLAPLGELIALGTNDQPCADFTRPSDVAATVRALAPDVIVNAAAYTAVDKAETDTQNAMAVNAITPGVLAEAAAGLGAWLVHYSTDYVFDGGGATPWREGDATAPLNEYGRSKLAGEENIRAAGGRHLIFRTSWVYAARGGNFAKTMLKLAQERDALKVIDDQYGAPTGAELLADISAHALRAALQQPELAGTYHAAPAGVTTWHGYASHVIAQARAAGLPLKVSDDAIQAVPTCAFPTPAQRPANSRLNTHKLRSAFGLHLPDWQAGVDRMLSEILQR